MDLGTPPGPGGEIFGSLIKNELHKNIGVIQLFIFFR
jgi:hypothetical protein